MSFFIRIFLSILFLASCSTSDESYIVENDPKYNLERFYSEVASWPYSVDEVKIDYFIKNYNKLVLGIEKDKVKELLGDPDVISRTISFKDESKFNIAWLYVMKMNKPILNSDSKLKGFSLYFDSSGLLFSAVPVNFNGVNELGSLDSDVVGRYVLYN